MPLPITSSTPTKVYNDMRRHIVETLLNMQKYIYRQVSNIRRTLAGN